MGSGYGYDVQAIGSGYGYDVQAMGSGYGYDVQAMGSGYEYDVQAMGSGYGYDVQAMGSGYGHDVQGIDSSHVNHVHAYWFGSDEHHFCFFRKGRTIFILSIGIATTVRMYNFPSSLMARLGMKMIEYLIVDSPIPYRRRSF
jgi:hypothetical protein